MHNTTCFLALVLVGCATGDDLDDVDEASQRSARAPQTTITSAPADPSGASVVFTFASSEKRSTFSCSLDGGAFVPCVSPMSLTLVDGEHLFAVFATDAGGHADPTPATHAWTVLGPDTFLTSVPPDPSGPDVTFTFASTVPGSAFACAVDGGAFMACASGFSLLSLASGVHLFEVRAEGDATPASYVWTVL